MQPYSEEWIELTSKWENSIIRTCGTIFPVNDIHKWLIFFSISQIMELIEDFSPENFIHIILVHFRGTYFKCVKFMLQNYRSGVFFCKYRNFVCLTLENFYVYDLNTAVTYSVPINQNTRILLLNEKKRNTLFATVDKD